jgi:hypothetical protein
MPSRYANKPDPAIRKNVQKSRAAARKNSSAHASVIATSIAATLIAWAAFTMGEVEANLAANPSAVGQAPPALTTPAPVPVVPASLGREPLNPSR